MAKSGQDEYPMSPREIENETIGKGGGTDTLAFS
jgi:hypothetical protein